MAEVQVRVVEVADQRAENRVEHQGFPSEAEEDQVNEVGPELGPKLLLLGAPGEEALESKHEDRDPSEADRIEVRSHRG